MPMICCAKLNLDRIFVNLSQTVLKMNANNAESRKRNYTPRENQKTLEGNEMLRQLHEEDGMGWTALSAVFGRDPDAIRKHYQ
jgi:predicted metalloendopeptidase